MKALIAMSGGVDSSVAAYLSKKRGLDCIGCTMILHDGSMDASDAKAVCRVMGMDHYTLDYSRDFTDTVVENFVCEYLQGRTPNPCIICNKQFKFKRLVEKAAELGCQYVISGHYAIIEEAGGRYLLRKGADSSKDQSYVLYNMTQDTLAHTLMPLGSMTKEEIRRIAGRQGFINADKKESQDICFIPDGDYGRFIEEYQARVHPDMELPGQGDFINAEGDVIGRHNGLIHYTIGQRKGLGQGFGKRVYVCQIDPARNTVTLGSNEDLFSRELIAERFNWISGKAPDGIIKCSARVRYNQKEQPAMVEALGEDRVRIIFDQPQRAVTPGQSAVLYDGDIVLGGGLIIK